MILTSIYTTIFVLVSFFNLISINNILKLISDDFVYQKAGFIAVGLQLIFSGINGYCRFTDKYLPLALISSLLSYSLIFACALIFQKKKKREKRENQPIKNEVLFWYGYRIPGNYGKIMTAL